MNTIYFEWYQMGNMAKVTAIDGESGHEIAIIVPIHTTQEYAQKIATKRLQQKLARLQSD